MPKCIKCHGELEIHWHTKLSSHNADGSDTYQTYGTSYFCNNLKYKRQPYFDSKHAGIKYLAYDPCPYYGLLQVGTETNNDK